MSKEKHFNQTAYRLLLLMQWLWESPLTLGEINARLEQNPRVGRSFSQDSLGLHINTLKSLGCRITRPSKTNQYRYHLTYMPFNCFLTPQDIQVLEETYDKTHNHLNYRDFIHLYQFFRKVFLFAANQNRHSLENSFFENLRYQPLEPLLPKIETLAAYCESLSPVRLQYHSPTKSLSTIDFIPHHLMHLNGTLYVMGYRKGRNTQSMLRISRIASITPLLDMDIAFGPSAPPHRYVVRIHHCTVSLYEPLGMNDTVSPDPEYPEHLLVTFTTDNDFLLKQKLLSSHYEFAVLSPKSFAQELKETLLAMRSQYA